MMTKGVEGAVGQREGQRERTGKLGAIWKSTAASLPQKCSC